MAFILITSHFFGIYTTSQLTSNLGTERTEDVSHSHLTRWCIPWGRFVPLILGMMLRTRESFLRYVVVSQRSSFKNRPIGACWFAKVRNLPAYPCLFLSMNMYSLDVFYLLIEPTGAVTSSFAVTTPCPLSPCSGRVAAWSINLGASSSASWWRFKSGTYLPIFSEDMIQSQSKRVRENHLLLSVWGSELLSFFATKIFFPMASKYPFYTWSCFPPTTKMQIHSYFYLHGLHRDGPHTSARLFPPSPRWWRPLQQACCLGKPWVSWHEQPTKATLIYFDAAEISLLRWKV